jgi:predicted secreted protein
MQHYDIHEQNHGVLLQILDTQAALMKAQNEEEGRGAANSNPAEVRRWNGIRTIVEARSLLKTLFRSAAGHKAQVTFWVMLRCLLPFRCLHERSQTHAAHVLLRVVEESPVHSSWHKALVTRRKCPFPPLFCLLIKQCTSKHALSLQFTYFQPSGVDKMSIL